MGVLAGVPTLCFQGVDIDPNYARVPLNQLANVEEVPAGEQCLLVAYPTDGSPRSIAFSATLWARVHDFAAEVEQLAEDPPGLVSRLEGHHEPAC